MPDIHAELAAARRRVTELEAQSKLGRPLTPATGPHGRLTKADITAIAKDPREYELRRDEVFEALAGYPTALPIDDATGQPVPLTREVLRGLSTDQILANQGAVDAALATLGKDAS